MSIPKRHHYVPRFVLANFVDNSGKLWVRRSSGGAGWSASPEDVYVERHRYSAINEAGQRDPALEAVYAVLEGATKPIVDEFLSVGREDRPPNITQSQKAIWDEFLYHQMKRVPAMTGALEAKQGWSDRLEAVVQRLRECGLAIDEEILDDLRSPAGLARVKQNATIMALSTHSPLVRMLLGTATIELGIAPDGASFVIGSHPIAGIRTGLQTVERDTSKMWMPIASDVAARVAFDGGPRTVRLTSEDVALVNRVSRSQSEYLAGASEEIVEAVN